MKKIILAVALLSMSQFSVANNLCESEAAVIKTISQAHQSGNSLGVILGAINRSTVTDATKEEMIKSSIEIFSGTRFSTETNQQLATTDATNAYLIKCLNKAKK